MEVVRDAVAMVLVLHSGSTSSWSVSAPGATVTLSGPTTVVSITKLVSPSSTPCQTVGGTALNFRHLTLAYGASVQSLDWSELILTQPVTL